MLPLSHEEIGRLVHHLCSIRDTPMHFTLDQLLFHAFDLKIVTPYEVLLKCCNSNRYVDVIDYLLKAELVQGDEDSNNPLRMATLMGSEHVIRRLLAESHIDPADRLGLGAWNAVDTAIMTFQYKVLNILLEDPRTANLDINLTLEAAMEVFQNEFARCFADLNNSDRYQALMEEFENGTIAWKGFIPTILRLLTEPRVRLTHQVCRLMPFQLIPHLDGIRAVKQNDAKLFHRWFGRMTKFQYFDVILDWVFAAITTSPTPAVWIALSAIGGSYTAYGDSRIRLICKMQTLFLYTRDILLPEIHCLVFANIVELIRNSL